MSSIFYINGEFVKREEAQLPAVDLAVIRGYGVFDFMRTYGGKPFHADEHIARLMRSAKLIDLEIPWLADEIKSLVYQTLARNTDHGESNVRIIVTGGDTDDYLTPKGEPRLLIMVTPALPVPQKYYTEGVKVVTVLHERYTPAAKTLNYIPAIQAIKKAKAQGAVEAIYTDSNGRALEGTTTNLFAFFGNKLVTPSEGILHGITRGVVMELASDMYEVEVRDLSVEELLRADEVFISASNKQVMPVVQVDEHQIASGQPGKHTRRIMETFAAFTRSTADA